MNNVTLLSLIVFAPLAGSFLLPLAGKVSKVLRNALAFLLVLTPLVLSALCIPAALNATPYSFNMQLPLGLNFGFHADGLALFMAVTASFLGLIIVLYSYGYMAHAEHQDEFYLMVVLFIGAMMGITLTTSLVFLYLFWEISALCCWRLIGFFREREYVRRANKAFLITGAGALVMLAGFLVIYAQYGTTDLLALRGKEVSNVAVTLILFGIFSKSATLPLHSWIADAGIAPTPVTALLHAAVLVKIGVYAFARLFLVTFEMEAFWHTAVPVIAAVSALLSAGAAIAENDIKRVIAYSTVSQLAFILLGLSVGSELAVAGGILYILMHGIAKGGLFLCAGIVEHTCHTKDITKLGGLSKTMPVTAASFFLCALSVMGVPPFGGFFSKDMVINGALQADQPWIAAVFVIGAVMTLIYLLRVFVKVFLGEPKAEVHTHPEGSPVMVFTVGLMAALSLVSGLLVNFPASMVGTIVKQLTEVLQ